MEDKPIMHMSDEYLLGYDYASFAHTVFGMVTIYDPDRRMITQYFEED